MAGQAPPVPPVPPVLLVRLEALGCARGGCTLFSGLELVLAAGAGAVVSGPNGAGKSSLLRIAAGLLRPQAGRVETVGAALLTEASALDGERTVRANLSFWASIDGVDAGTVDDALASCAMTQLADVPVRLLSSGQSRRAAIARVLASGRALWLLDEPTNGLDADAVRLLELAIARHRAGGGAVILATHQPVDLPGAQLVRLG